MELEINGKVYQFKFGIGFVKEINPTMTRTENGVTENIGLQANIYLIKNKDILALEKALMTANKGENPRITVKELDDFLDDPCTDVDKLFDEVMNFFKNTNATKNTALVVEKM